MSNVGLFKGGNTMHRHVLATVGGRHDLPAVDVNFFDGAVENPMDFDAIESHL